MGVAVLSDSPTVTTGFGRTTRHMASALARASHQVDCFGIKARPTDVPPEPLPYRVWPADRGGPWSETLPAFFKATQPDVLLLNMDAYNAVECLAECRDAGWRGPTVSYVCFDGIPVGRRYLEAQRSCDAVWATSQMGARYLRSSGIQVEGTAPPGVDGRVFRPLLDRDALREQAGLAGDDLLIGAFATNTERKQLPRVLRAFSHLIPQVGDRSPRLYLHCRPRGFWDLDELAETLGIADKVLFPGQDDFDEQRGVPASAARAARPAPGSDLTYVERLNCCDVVINLPHSGDVEQVILEAQSCGVPLVHTDDGGVMAEALGDGGLAVASCDVGTGRFGQPLHHIAPADAADALQRVLTDPSLRAHLVAAGEENAATYGWGVLETAAVAMVAPFTHQVAGA